MEILPLECVFSHVPTFLMQFPDLSLPVWLGLENLNENVAFNIYLFICLFIIFTIWGPSANSLIGFCCLPFWYQNRTRHS